jgi:transcriptional regulator with XRE-family HTH domain
MEIRKLIGNRILELRKEKGLSQEALANIAEVDRTYMTGVETGKRNISVMILLKIIVALGTNYKEFFNHHSFGSDQ